MLLTLFALAAAQSNLDAAVDTRPTVRTEIRRGYAAADSCFDPTKVPILQAYDCVVATEEANHQRLGAGFEAFDAGLFFGAKRIGSAMIEPIGPNQSIYSPAEVHLLRSSLDFYSTGYTANRDRLKLADSDVESAARGY